MSPLPKCTCNRFGQYSSKCARHRSSARYQRFMGQQRAEQLRRQALTRPAHGGYPGVVR